jgi:hypothetical protein
MITLILVKSRHPPPEQPFAGDHEIRGNAELGLRPEAYHQSQNHRQCANGSVPTRMLISKGCSPSVSRNRLSQAHYREVNGVCRCEVDRRINDSTARFESLALLPLGVPTLLLHRSRVSEKSVLRERMLIAVIHQKFTEL